LLRFSQQPVQVHGARHLSEKLVVSIERHVAANQHNENLELARLRAENADLRERLRSS
jgi:hypothetical protein